MEILGNKNTTETILNKITAANRRLLSYRTIPENCAQDLIEVLSDLLLTGDTLLLYKKETAAFLLLLSEHPASDFPLILNLMTELKLRFIRLICLSAQETESPDTSSAYTGKKEGVERERFTPTKDNCFILPPAGEITNLTVSEPDPNLGKTLIRDLMIDSEGYVVEERSRRYEDFYTDESEEIYNNAYLNELKKIEAGEGEQ